MRWLIDEMFAPDVAVELERLGHQAWSVHAIGLVRTPDLVIMRYAAGRSLVLVTANRNDFLRLSRDLIGRREPTTAIVIVRTSTLPAGGALPFHLAQRLDRWAAQYPNPALIPYWLPADG